MIKWNSLSLRFGCHNTELREKNIDNPPPLHAKEVSAGVQDLQRRELVTILRDLAHS